MTGMLSMRDVMRPIDVPTRETVAFLMSHLSAEASLLEIGCGEGDVGSLLLRRGNRIVGVDADCEVVAAAQRKGVEAVCAGWPDYKGDAVDGVAFTRSLHHIAPLGPAIRKARQLLRVEGILLVEDFDFHDIDEKTIDWFVDILRSTVDERLIKPIRGAFVTDLLTAGNANAFWHEDHDHDLHSVGAMCDAIAQDFSTQEVRQAPYLYRYLISVLPATTRATEFVEHVLKEETRLGIGGDIRLIGRRIVAFL